MIAVSRVTVNHHGKGGTAPDLLVWEQGSGSKQRKVHNRVVVDLSTLPGPPVFFFLNGPLI